VTETGNKRRATVHDVAREAGVSLATVDRVLNARPGVRPATVEKVEAAIAAIGFQRDLSASLLARARDLNLIFLIPDGNNEFMDSLVDAVARQDSQSTIDRVHVITQRVRALNPAALANALDSLKTNSCDCVVIVASDHADVRAAVDRASRRGIVVLTLVSDISGTLRQHFIGIDNYAAGRTAASLLGRFLPQGGKIGIVAGSLNLRDHADRLAGFQAVMQSEFPKLVVVGPLEGQDDPSATQTLVTTLLRNHPDLAGIYNLGAGNVGVVAALETEARAKSIRVIAHELTEPTRRGLDSGVIDVVLVQNPDSEIRAAISMARSLALGGASAIESHQIEIGIFLRDNLR
jgi:LacI family transcriptional regulator